MKVQEISAKQNLMVLHWSIGRKVVIIKKYCLSKGKFPTLTVLALCLILYSRASSSSLFCPFVSLFLTFRFAAHHLLLIASYLHPGREENSDIHTPREDDVNDLFISKSKKKSEREGR